MIINRGALIVLEGCDRSGKSTQSRKLVESLKKRNILADTMSFPDRSTATGKLIAEYLMNKIELNDRTIHLLFSANRWELSKKIERMLHDGITLIIDRYAYSGVVYSSVKPGKYYISCTYKRDDGMIERMFPSGMDKNWCLQADAGLPKPDLVFLMTLSNEALAKRPGYGNERYESSNTQRRVAEMYMKLKEDSWVTVDADGSVDDVHQLLLNDVLKRIETVKNKPLETLW